MLAGEAKNKWIKVVGTAALVAIVMAMMPLIAMASPITISVSTTKVTPGGTVTVSGKASPNAVVTAVLVNPKGTVIPIAQVQAGSDGSYSFNIKFPTKSTTLMPYGQYTIKVKDTTTGDVASTTIMFGALAEIKGIVVDEAGAPVEGATVEITETGLQATTAGDGSFSIWVSSAGTYTLVVTKPGYTKAVVSVNAKPGVNDAGKITIKSLEYMIKVLNSTLTASISNLKNRVNTLEDNLNKLQAQVSDVASKIDELTNKIDMLNNNINNLASNVDNLGNSISSISSEISLLKSEISSLKDAISSISASMGDLKSSMNKLSGDVTSSLSDVKNVVNGLRSDIQGLRQDVASLTSNVNSVSTEVGTINANLGGKIDSLTPIVYVTVIFALLAFIFALMSWNTVRKALTAK